MITRYLFIAILAAYAITTSEDHPMDNQAPVVKIQTPAPHTTVSPGTTVPYEITVADKEDGDSRYDEINPKEVVLMIRDAPTSSTAPLKDPGLAAMARSNCFNCHAFNGKLIGPSLADIARRYGRFAAGFTAAAADTLGKRIKDGSAGIWGKEKMPSHPELSTDEIRAMVHWIDRYASADGVNYQLGTSGVLQLRPDGSLVNPGIYTLTAAYTDHGTKDTKTGPYLTGLDQITLTIK